MSPPFSLSLFIKINCLSARAEMDLFISSSLGLRFLIFSALSVTGIFFISAMILSTSVFFASMAFLYSIAAARSWSTFIFSACAFTCGIGAFSSAFFSQPASTNESVRQVRIAIVR